MRNIKVAVIHCSATRELKDFKVADIEAMHAKRFKKIGGSHIGYHHVILLDGTDIQTKDYDFIGQHVAGANAETLGIVYIGGLDKAGKKGKDTRTQKQKGAIQFRLMELKKQFPALKIRGHRDYSPDLDGDGILEPWEFMKECPCFDARKEYAHIENYTE